MTCLPSFPEWGALLFWSKESWQRQKRSGRGWKPSPKPTLRMCWRNSVSRQRCPTFVFQAGGVAEGPSFRCCHSQRSDPQGHAGRDRGTGAHAVQSTKTRVRCSRSWAFEAMSSANETDLYVLMGLPGTVLDWTPEGWGWSRLATLRHPMWEGCGKPTGRIGLGVGLGLCFRLDPCHDLLEFIGQLGTGLHWPSRDRWRP